MALQAHLICSLCHCLFLPFFFIFVMHLDHRPPEIFLHFTTCTLEAFLSTSPLKQHHSHLSAHTEETRETATLVFFSQIQNSQRSTLRQKRHFKTVLFQDYKTTEFCWGPIWNTSDCLIFCDEKTNSSAPKGRKQEKL